MSYLDSLIPIRGILRKVGAAYTRLTYRPWLSFEGAVSVEDDPTYVDPVTGRVVGRTKVSVSGGGSGDLSDATPVAVNTTASAGTAESAARADHRHTLADGAVTLPKHANITGPAALARISGTGAPQATAMASAATPSTIAMRDASGRMRVADPSNAGDVATKAYVDGVVSTGVPNPWVFAEHFAVEAPYGWAIETVELTIDTSLFYVVGSTFETTTGDAGIVYFDGNEIQIVGRGTDDVGGSGSPNRIRIAAARVDLEGDVYVDGSPLGTGGSVTVAAIDAAYRAASDDGVSLDVNTADGGEWSVTAGGSASLFAPLPQLIGSSSVRISSPTVHVGVGPSEARNTFDTDGTSHRRRVYGTANTLGLTETSNASATTLAAAGTLGIDAASTMTVGTGTQTGLTVGRSGASTAVNGNLINIIAGASGMSIVSGGVLNLRGAPFVALQDSSANSRHVHNAVAPSAIASATTTHLAQIVLATGLPTTVERWVRVYRTSSPDETTTAIWHVRYHGIVVSGAIVDIGTPEITLVSGAVDDGCSLAWTKSGTTLRLSLTTPDATARTARAYLEHTQ